MSADTLPNARAEALFASGLPLAGITTRDAAAAAIRDAVRRHHIDGCIAIVAQEFGDHPDTAVTRMCDCRRIVHTVFRREPRL